MNGRRKRLWKRKHTHVDGELAQVRIELSGAVLISTSVLVSRTPGTSLRTRSALNPSSFTALAAEEGNNANTYNRNVPIRVSFEAPTIPFETAVPVHLAPFVVYTVI